MKKLVSGFIPRVFTFAKLLGTSIFFFFGWCIHQHPFFWVYTFKIGRGRYVSDIIGNIAEFLFLFF
ncbi:hypothetical protein BD770DRAFT_392117 [Pilaira anomala]|nr:hypothetical protein BD770DRAFT_392117 [Pilaira anomala]